MFVFERSGPIVWSLLTAGAGIGSGAGGKHLGGLYHRDVCIYQVAHWLVGNLLVEAVC